MATSTLFGTTKKYLITALLPLIALFATLTLTAAPVWADSVVATIPTVIQPVAIALNPVTNKIYVANYASNTVTVIDGTTNTTTTVAVGTYPLAIAVNPATNKIYVANVSSQSLTVIDGVTNFATTITIPVAYSTVGSIAVNPVTNKIYVTSSSNTVAVIDGANNSITTITVSGLPYSIGLRTVAVNAVTNKIYVAGTGGYSNNGTVTVIDGITNTYTTLTAGIDPNAIAINPITNQIYVANYWSGTVMVIDGDSNSITTIGAGVYPNGLAINPITNKIYVANIAGSTIRVIDGATNSTSIVAVDSNYGYQRAIAVNPVTNKIYVTRDGDIVTVIDGTSNSISTVAVGRDPTPIAVNSITNRVYVGNNSGSVTVIGSNPMLTRIAVTPLNPTIHVSQTQQFTATGSFSDGTSRVLPPSAIDRPTLVSSQVFGGAGDQVGNGITLTNGNIYWAGSDGATGDGRFGNYNTALTTSNFNQTLGGNYGDLSAIATLDGSLYVGGSSRPPNLTVDNVGVWENKPVILKAPSAFGAPKNWTTQITGAGYGDRMFSYSGIEVTNGIALDDAGLGNLYATGVGENWDDTSHNALWLSKLNRSGVKQWAVSYGQPGAFTAGNDLTVFGGDIYVAGQAGENAIIYKYRDDGETATLLYGNTYGSGVFNDITSLDGFLYAAGSAGADARIVKIDATGAQQWSQTYDFGTANDVLYGIVGYNSRLFAVGRNANDAVIIEINPATGLVVGLPTSYNGINSLEDVFNEVAVDHVNGRLYAIGYTTSFVFGQDVLIAAYNPPPVGVTWASSNTSVATISPTGLATALNAGTTTITTASGSISTSTTLNVILDTTPPVLSSSSNLTATATNASGAIVTYTRPTATDNVDASVIVACTPLSGSTFPIGITPVVCNASDTAGNTGSSSFTVSVVDTAPTLSSNSNLTVSATRAFLI